MKNYFVQMWDDQGQDHLIESGLFDTFEKAKDWYDNICFISPSIRAEIMSVFIDENGNFSEKDKDLEMHLR